MNQLRAAALRGASTRTLFYPYVESRQEGSQRQYAAEQGWLGSRRGVPCMAGCRLPACPEISEAVRLIRRGCVIDEVWQEEQVTQEWLILLETPRENVFQEHATAFCLFPSLSPGFIPLLRKSGFSCNVFVSGHNRSQSD